MCTTISDRLPVAGSAKGPNGWFSIDHAYISYDHPTHSQLDHALMVDLVSEALGPDHRIAVELDRDTAQTLATRILAALAEADAYEGAD